MPLNKNDKAIDFTLKHKTPEGLKDVKLTDYLGEKRIVLLFFPLAFTGGCTNEMCTISNDLSEYDKLDAQVLAISVDSPFAQEAWVKENDITIPVLSDFNKEVCRAYGVCYEEFLGLGLKGVAKRAAFVINKEQVITYSWVTEDPKNLPNFDEIKKALL